MGISGIKSTNILKLVNRNKQKANGQTRPEQQVQVTPNIVQDKGDSAESFLSKNNFLVNKKKLLDKLGNSQKLIEVKLKVISKLVENLSDKVAGIRQTIKQSEVLYAEAKVTSSKKTIRPALKRLIQNRHYLKMTSHNLGIAK